MRLARFIVALLLLAPVVARAGEKITVSAAISLKGALVEIGRSYSAATGDEVSFNFGASGQLMAQIEQGAPVDAFISAADKQVDALTAAGLVGPERVIVAGNVLVLVAPAGAEAPPRGFEDLASASTGRVAIGQPKTVPAGEYAAQTLTALRLYDAIRPRLVYGANVRQVLDYVERGEVDAGIVYRTDAIEAGDKVHVVATADDSLHDVIRYPAAVVAASHKREAAERFLRHLRGRDAQAVLVAKGFTPPPPQPLDGDAAPATTPATAPAAAPAP